MAKTYAQITDEEIAAHNGQLAAKDSIDVLRWAYEQYGDNLVYACSFGAEGIVLTDLISRVKKDAKIVFLDTNFHFYETYKLIEAMKAKYPTLNIVMQQPEVSVEQQTAQYGDKLWETNPDECCRIRKIIPLENVLGAHDAWISGLRHEQSEGRKSVQFVNRDNRFQSLKICPLIHWKWDDVWMYIKGFKLPYNELHDKGYPSIGCAHCTNPVAEGEDSRAGRWSGKTKKECGLHT